MNRVRGFTIVELAITLAVLAVLVAIAAPSFLNMIQNNRLTTQSNMLVASLVLARSEAAKRKIAVSVCSRTSPPTIPETCSGNTNWNTGWLVFVDVQTNYTGDGVYVDNGTGSVCEVNTNNRPAEDCLLKVHPALWNGWDLNGAVSFVTYLSTGSSGGSQVFTLSPADCSGDEARQVQIGPSGRPYTNTDPANC